MRAFVGLLTLLLLLSLCACGTVGTQEASPPSVTTTTYPTNALGEPDFSAITTPTDPDRDGYAYRGDVWDEELMPDEFPAPIPVARAISTLHDPASQLLGDDPCEAWILSLTLTAQQWNALCEAFVEAGWGGGGTDAVATHATQVDGAWLGARHYAYVWHSEYDEGAWLHTVQIAVFRRATWTFPASLAADFPAFTAGYTHTGGSAVTTADGTTRHTFGGAGRFVGVTETEQAAYQQTLRENGFSVTARGNHGTEWVATATARRVEAIFDPASHTLELVYTIAQV